MTKTEIELMKGALLYAPHPVLIFAARYFIAERDRDTIPDWIAALAGGDPERWDKLLEEVTIEMRLEAIS